MEAMNMILPHYADAQSRLLDGTENDLDRFIVEHEPEEKHGQATFRADLADLLAFVETQTKLKCDADIKQLRYRLSSALDVLAEQESRHLDELHDMFDAYSLKMAHVFRDHVIYVVLSATAAAVIAWLIYGGLK